MIDLTDTYASMSDAQKKWFDKDRLKAARCNKMIAHPESVGATGAYLKCAETQGCVNVGNYVYTDNVFLSINGKLNNQAGMYLAELEKAVAANVSFWCDPPNRRLSTNPYNTGEEELVQYLKECGYRERIEGQSSCWYCPVVVVNKHKHTPTERDVAVHRPSVLGNPFTHKKGTLARHVVGTRDEAIAAYKDWLDGQLADGNPAVRAELNRIYTMARIGTVYLVCYCSPSPCHAGYIKKLILEKLP